MGYEYNINFDIDESDEVESLLKSLPHFEKTFIFENRKQYIYRLPSNSGEMPNGIAEIEKNSIYFCDYGGGNDVLKEIIFRIGLCYGKLEVKDHNE